jgi:hypothetical protein
MDMGSVEPRNRTKNGAAGIGCGVQDREGSAEKLPERDRSRSRLLNEGVRTMRDDLPSLTELVERIERSNEETSKIIAETKQLTAQADDVLRQIQRYKSR